MNAEGGFAAWRERLGWTQAQAAAALGVTRTTYLTWELGHSYTTGKPVAAPKVAELAAAALEAGLPPIQICPAAESRYAQQLNPDMPSS